MTVDLAKLVDTVAARIIAHAEEGLNMKRGFEQVLADRANILAKPLPDALKSIGMTLVMKVGGASGPLYGTLFMTLGKELSADPQVTDLPRAMQAVVDAIKARGKSDIGCKTMLDVLAPVTAELASGKASFDSIRKVAADAAAATVPMKATRGRASFLGDRSIGHMDPGSRSSQLIIEAICDVLEGRA
jgi:dihydroxyacetone kinase-like protein